MKPLIRLMATFGDGGAGQVRLRCALDSGMPCAVLPERAWSRLSPAPSGMRTVRLGDGTAETRPISECTVSTRFGERRIAAMLGGWDDVAVFPAALFQEFGLMLHPFSRTVMPRAREA